MAKIDLTSFEWCELIFKGKNKRGNGHCVDNSFSRF